MKVRSLHLLSNHSASFRLICGVTASFLSADAYFWMSIRVEVSGGIKTEKHVTKMVRAKICCICLKNLSAFHCHSFNSFKMSAYHKQVLPAED